MAIEFFFNLNEYRPISERLISKLLINIYNRFYNANNFTINYNGFKIYWGLCAYKFTLKKMVVIWEKKYKIFLNVLNKKKLLSTFSLNTLNFYEKLE